MDDGVHYEVLPTLVSRMSGRNELDKDRMEVDFYRVLFRNGRMRECIAIAIGGDVTEDGGDGCLPELRHVGRADESEFRATLKEVALVAAHGHLQFDGDEGCETAMRKLWREDGVQGDDALHLKLQGYRSKRRRAALEVMVVHFFQTHRYTHGYELPKEGFRNLSTAASQLDRSPPRRRRRGERCAMEEG